MARKIRSQKLNGLFPLSYVGVIPTSPGNFIIDNRPPTSSDSQNFYIGDMWLDNTTDSPITAANIWMLVDLSQGVATWINFCCGTGPSVEITIIGDTGGPIVGAEFVFSGGSTGLSFNGSGDTLTLTFSGITANGGPVDLATDAINSVVDIGTGSGQKTSVLGSATALSTTVIQAPSGGLTMLGIQGVAVSNKRYVAVNSVSGQVGADSGTTSGITITGNTGGPMTSASFTFAGGSTGLSFNGVGNQEILQFAGITANGGTVSLATDAITSTVNIGTGAGNKTVALGSTNTTSTTNLQGGSGGIKIPAFAEGVLETDASGVISAVTGTVGYVLTANSAGTQPDFKPLGAGTRQLIQEQTVFDVGNLDFVSGITGYSYYVLEALNYSVNNSGSVLRVFFSSDGGGSWASYQYQNFVWGTDSHVATFLGKMLAFSGAGMFFTDFPPAAYPIDSNGPAGWAIMKLFGLGDGSATKKMIQSGVCLNGFTRTLQMLSVGGTNNTSVANGIRLSLGGGIQVFSGTFRLFGVV